MVTTLPITQSDVLNIPCGMDLLDSPTLNKGTEAFQRNDNNLERHIYLRVLQDPNEVLFYRLLVDHYLILVTALNPHIGYEKVAKISLTAFREDVSLREAALKLGFLSGEQFDSWVRPEEISPAGRKAMSEWWKVVIVGGGFAGLSAAQHLNSNLLDVTLIDCRNYYLFQPLLYQAATGSLSAGEIASPQRSVLRRQKNTRVGLELLWI